MVKQTAFNARLHAAAIIRGKRALKLKAAGKTWREIGLAMGISRQRAFQLAQNVREKR